MTDSSSASPSNLAISRGDTEVTEHFIQGARMGPDGILLSADGEALGTYLITSRFAMPPGHWRRDRRCHVRATIQGRTYWAGMVDEKKAVFNGRRIAAELKAPKTTRSRSRSQ